MPVSTLQQRHQRGRLALRFAAWLAPALLAVAAAGASAGGTKYTPAHVPEYAAVQAADRVVPIGAPALRFGSPGCARFAGEGGVPMDKRSAHPQCLPVPAEGIAKAAEPTIDIQVAQ